MIEHKNKKAANTEVNETENELKTSKSELSNANLKEDNAASNMGVQNNLMDNSVSNDDEENSQSDFENDKQEGGDKSFSIFKFLTAGNLKSLVTSGCNCVLFALVSICFALEMLKFKEVEIIVSNICLVVFILTTIICLLSLCVFIVSLVKYFKNHLKCKNNKKEV